MRYPKITKKVIPFASGILLTSVFGIQSAHALNGFTYLLSCASCATTTDFATEAKRQAGVQSEGGTYLVISGSQSSSAYLQVTGHIVTHGGEPEWVPTAAVPVDENGNSLGGNTESQNQAYFAALDQTVFGSDRILVAAATLPAKINEPPNYSVSIINSDDAEVGPGIDQALLALGINWSNSIKEGTVVTVVFQDGTKAQFIKFNGKMSDHWKWNGKAWDKKGNRIGRDGVPLVNNNTSGLSGGTASFNVGQTRYDFGGVEQCLWQQSITVDGSTESSFFLEPC